MQNMSTRLHKFHSCMHGPYIVVHSLALHTFQVGFLRSIACPCSELLLNVLPRVEKLLRNAQ